MLVGELNYINKEYMLDILPSTFPLYPNLSLLLGTNLYFQRACPNKREFYALKKQCHEKMELELLG